MDKLIFKLAILLVLASCSSNPKVAEDKVVTDQPDVVISRIDNMSERPSWVKESELMIFKDGNIYFTGLQTVPANSNAEQVYRAAELNAKAGIAKAIEQKLQVVFQNAEEGYSLDANQARFMGIEATDLIRTSSIRPYRRYWEKVRTTNDDGQRVTQLKMFAVVSMPEADFKKAILDAAKKREGKGGISEDFAKKVDQQWDNILSDRQPATNE